MTEQTAGYAGLESLTSHLIVALTRCEPHSIESLSRTGETELFRMRSRQLEITSCLTNFGEIRAGQTDLLPLTSDTREKFESSANGLLEAARKFEKVARRAASLAHGGSSFAAANIQMCGVPPTTYRAPVLKYSRG
ncbi:MAG: hypothetical protein ABI999_14305 [Acidobacteriota bacterium]